MSSRVYNLLEMATNFALPSDDAASFPWLQVLLDLSHVILCCLQVRNECPDLAYSRRYPVATLFACTITSLAGSFIANLLLGLPLIADIAQNTHTFLLILSCWYLVFYSPFDICYRVCNSYLALKLPLSIFKELGRARKVSKGISLANSVYPGSIPIMILIGTVKGTGSSFMRPFVLMSQGYSIHEGNLDTLAKPSFTTKATFLAACILVIAFGRENGIAGLGYPQIVFIISLLFVYAKVSLTLLKLGDPLVPLENLLCMMCFGRETLSLKKVDEAELTSQPSQRISQAGGPGLSRASSTMQSGLHRTKAD